MTKLYMKLTVEMRPFTGLIGFLSPNNPEYHYTVTGGSMGN